MKLAGEIRKIIFLIVAGLFFSMCVTGCDLDDEEASLPEETVEEINTREEENSEEEDSEEEFSEEEFLEEKLLEEEFSEDEEALEDDYPVGEGKNISFETNDINGATFSTEMISDAKLVMLNLWEPWCGPCVREMPDLNQLYEDYKDKGLLIVGSYSTFEMDSDAKEIIDRLGISYPIIKCNQSINSIAQDYVPATYLLDRNGNLITEEPFVGSDSYSGWESVILEYIQ